MVIKKVLSLILSLTLIIGILPLGGIFVNADGVLLKEGDYYYDIVDAGARIVDIVGNPALFCPQSKNIPEFIGGFPVVIIGARAFSDCANITEIVIPDSVVTVGAYAFSGCSTLKTITIPDSVECIAEGAFEKCLDLKNVYIAGSADIWENVIISKGNEKFKNVEPQFVHKHTYDNVCDKICNDVTCGYIRVVPDHIYDDATDAICNECGFERSVLLVTQQPVDACVKSGATAKVTITAIGEDLTYTWYIKNKGSSKFSKSSIVTNTYSVKMSSTVKDRTVYCVVTDKNGNKITSKEAVLKMAASITTQPKTTYTKSGATAKVTVKATGDGLKYTWYIKNSGASKYSKSSVKTSSYSVKMSSTTKNRLVYCVVSDKYGKTVKSTTVVLRMAATITTQPKSVKVAINKTAKVTVKAAGDGLKYTWYVKNPGSSKYTKSSITKSTYSVKMTKKISGRLVYCVVKDKYGKTVKSTTVSLKKK